jgi:hypothetical protein
MNLIINLTKSSILNETNIDSVNEPSLFYTIINYWYIIDILEMCTWAGIISSYVILACVIKIFKVEYADQKIKKKKKKNIILPKYAKLLKDRVKDKKSKIGNNLILILLLFLYLLYNYIYVVSFRFMR